MKTNGLVLILILAGLARGGVAEAAPENPGSVDTPGDSASTRQSRDDAWWTGPLLAASPSTLPQGHFLIEPYVFDGIPDGRYDETGRRQPGPHQNDFGSQSYVLYGLVDTVSVGLIPRFGFDELSEGRSSSKVGIGDLTLQAQYRLTQFAEGGWVPTTALVLGETLPTGKFDRLGDRPADGLGAGVYTTTVSLYSQYFFWLPTGRILRTRLDVSYGFSGSAGIRDVSVYGTTQGFQGRVRPGDSILADGAFEYSLTRSWVLALDVAYEHDSNTRVAGLDTQVVGLDPQRSGAGGLSLPVELNSGTGHTWSLAPALEYNFNSRVGLIAGAKLTVAGRNATAEVIPVAAINIVI
jgi:hypothetical protein